MDQGDQLWTPRASIHKAPGHSRQHRRLEQATRGLRVSPYPVGERETGRQQHQNHCSLTLPVHGRVNLHIASKLEKGQLETVPLLGEDLPSHPGGEDLPAL